MHVTHTHVYIYYRHIESIEYCFFFFCTRLVLQIHRISMIRGHFQVFTVTFERQCVRLLNFDTMISGHLGEREIWAGPAMSQMFVSDFGNDKLCFAFSAGWLQFPDVSSLFFLVPDCNSVDFWQQKHPFLAMLWRNQEVYQAAQDQQPNWLLCNISLDADFKDRTLVKSTAPTSLQSLLLESPWRAGHKPVPARWIYHDGGPFMTFHDYWNCY